MPAHPSLMEKLSGKSQHDPSIIYANIAKNKNKETLKTFLTGWKSPNISIWGIFKTTKANRQF